MYTSVFALIDVCHQDEVQETSENFLIKKITLDYIKSIELLLLLFVVHVVIHVDVEQVHDL
jgi:hypothetical protein